MRRLILTAIAAASFAAVVSAREYISGPAGAARDVPSDYAVIEAGGQSQLALETLEKLIPGTDPAAPQITFAVRSADPVGDALSPDGGSALNDMAAWQIQILDSSAKKVSFIQGSGQPPPPMLSWSGLSGNGEQLPSGFYTARLVWMDKAKKVYTTPAVSFNLFSRLSMPEFAELKLDFRFSGGMPLL